MYTIIICMENANCKAATAKLENATKNELRTHGKRMNEVEGKNNENKELN